MKRILAFLALAAALAAPPAFAQTTYRSADGLNNTPVALAAPLPVLPIAGTPLAISSGNKANASAAAVLAAATGKLTYITGFQLTAAGATAASVVNATVSDGTWTLTYSFVFPAGVTAQATPLSVVFPIPIPATAANTAITVTLPAGGAGNTNASATAEGFQL